MIWLIFALVSALASSIQSLIHRFIMLTEEPYSYALVENLLTALIFVPVLILEFSFPNSYFAWFLVLVSSLLWVFIAVISMKAYKYTKVSLKAPLSQSRVIFALLFAILFLSEAIVLEKIIGIALIFAALTLLTYKKERKFGQLKDIGVQFTILSAFLSALVAIIDKKSMAYFTPGTFGFLVYFIPALILIAFGKKYYKGVKQIVETKYKFLAALVILGFFFYYFKLRAYQLADVGQVFPIVRLSTLFTVVGGVVFLKERDQIVKKIVLTLIILVGIILVSGYYSLF